MLPELLEISSHDSSLVLLVQMALVYNPNEVPDECWDKLVFDRRLD
jgi:hypothetical protein